MPKKVVSNNVKAAASPSVSDSSSSAKHDPVKISNLYDGGSVKGALDDCVKEIVTDSGFEENVFVSNVKIVAGIISICLALYAQFGPGKFPSTYWTVFACVVAYSVLTSLLYMYTWAVEGDSFVVLKAPKQEQTSENSGEIRLSSKLERFDDQYTLCITEATPPRGLRRKAFNKSETWSIANFFHADGYLSEAALKKEILKLLQEYAQELQNIAPVLPDHVCKGRTDDEASMQRRQAKKAL
ncbi:hypothetical protein CEUSTIGMA_g12102.t1 [Chlamydomonas eustigma]|uniref:Signal peptidase complex subunit 2 n=1 Tax=Chlamydomonas eustigma TaxID=1157962 RepID=A0A250XNL2_9CHLO|nr:hypothetical protein CEUSTIGMA_g12102.t1 [Chlamydomonas eustigma]|eukprot:GAX84681.1 hypothetical protein CEUSTIGMA_g12102.t1 [Chlamydomonas eustigma]